MTSYQISINGSIRSVEAEEDTPMLWILRDELKLKGTKFGCGIGQCGACTIHLNGRAIRSCQIPVSAIGNQKVTTIEGLSSGKLHPVQEAWVDENVPQCGYCQSGQIMTAAALLSQNPRPSVNQIDQAMSGNICRCGTYPRIKKAIATAITKGGSR